MFNITIYADGSCIRNGQDGAKAGWAAILSCNGKTKQLSGKIEAAKPTNNIAELTAVIEAINAIKTDAEAQVKIVSDSEYVVKSILEKRPKTWRLNGWKTASKGPVANKELWIKLGDVYKAHTKCKFEFVHVDGHSGDVMNELCDKLARAAASK